MWININLFYNSKTVLEYTIQSFLKILKRLFIYLDKGNSTLELEKKGIGIPQLSRITTLFPNKWILFNFKKE